MISTFLKEKIAEDFLEDTLRLEMLTEVFKLDKDTVVKLLTEYINKTT